MRLRELHRWLTLEGSSAALVGGGFVMPYGYIIGLLVLGAIIFTPYMLRRLYQVRRFGWIAGFGVFVGLPVLVALGISTGVVLGYVLWVLPLLFFYIYTWTLRLAVGGWLEDLSWQMENQRAAIRNSDDLAYQTVPGLP